ncbi:unnamed protein product [Effrenium voratum]|nr:unnamed protein product [Effrenium voratum]
MASEELLERASAGRHQDVQRLLEERADVEWADRNGYTALSEAAMAGHTIVVGQLLRALADPNSQAVDGRSPLHRAAVHGWLPIARLLVEHGGDPELADDDGRTPTQLAAKESMREVLEGALSGPHFEAIEARRASRKVRQRPASPKALPPRPPPQTRRLEPETKKDSEGKESDSNFLELHPTLDIVAQPDGFAARGAGGAGYGNGGPDVRLQQGSLIVETSDGLFASDEVGKEKGPSEEEKAEAWLQDAALPPLALTMEALLDAKARAQELFNAGQANEARKVTTAAIHAATCLVATEPSEDLENLLGVLHSNRSLLLTHQIQNSDPEVQSLGFAVWQLVVKDTDAALARNPKNFKASFRRAKALFELGDLDQAMQDATQVVDHYARNTQVSNPEAVALRQAIMQELKKERAKWGDKGGPRWNRAAENLITEVS